MNLSGPQGHKQPLCRSYTMNKFKKKKQILNVKKNNIILEANKYWTLSKIKLSTTKIWVCEPFFFV